VTGPGREPASPRDPRRVFTRPGEPGQVARRLLAAGLAFPAGYGAFYVLFLEPAGMSPGVAGWVLVGASMASWAVIAWWTGVRLAELDEARQAAAADRARLLESEREARANAEAASRAKDEFVATVSHELRTPLNAVLGWARLLRGGRLDAAATARALEAIERSAGAQARIVDDLLDISRMVRGELRLDVRPVDLAPVVEAAADTVRHAASARGIELWVSIAPKVASVAGDPGRLQQVVWNLLANAIKFSPAGGRVEVGLEPDGEEVVVSVRDGGSGIPPEFLPHLFEPFRQADGSSTRRHGGLGLGLAIVRHLVEAHGGTVAVASAGEGRGSTFSVRLPTARPMARATPAPPVVEAATETPAPLVPLRSLRVVVVDDDPDTLEVVQQVLEEAGAAVTAVRSATEAIEAVRASPPDVLLSDIAMPGEDGLSLIRQLRALEASRGGRTPAAALSAHTQGEDRRQAMQAGFQAYLAKPIEPSELTAAVARLAGRLQ
jgi:signal transduction histidine kinase/CheY-like chemotaxis protein